MNDIKRSESEKDADHLCSLHPSMAFFKYISLIRRHVLALIYTVTHSLDDILIIKLCFFDMSDINRIACHDLFDIFFFDQ